MSLLKWLFRNRHDPEAHEIRNHLAVARTKSDLTSRRIEQMARREVLRLKLLHEMRVLEQEGKH